jgi:hypothetical protein
MTRLGAVIASLVVCGCSGGGEFMPRPDGGAMGSDGGGAADLTMAAMPDMARQPLTKISFAQAVSYPTGMGPASVAVGQFDNFPGPDVAVSNNTGGSVAIFHGAGGGVLQPTMTIPVSSPAGIIAADLDGDQIDDLALASATAAVVVRSTGTGWLAAVNYPLAGMRAIAVADLNGDFHPDIAASDGAGVASMINKGDGTFLNWTQLATPSASGIAAGDLDGDGKIDLLAGEASGPMVYVMQNTGTGLTMKGTAPLPFIPLGMILADFSGDGKLEAAIAGMSGVAVLPGKGDGTFQTAVELGGITNVATPRAADFNLDGQLDLVVSDGQSMSVHLFLNNGGGMFAAPMAFPLGKQLGGIAVHDLDGDGKPDILVADVTDGAVLVMLNSSI